MYLLINDLVTNFKYITYHIFYIYAMTPYISFMKGPNSQ